MITHEKYVDEKTKLSYEKYLRDELFEKARAVILKDGQIAYIRNLKTGSVFIPGGGVDEGESSEQAAVREAYEETGIKVEPLFKLVANYYDVPMKIGQTDFVSKRVEYVYLCKYLERDEGMSGLEGEYEAGSEVFFDKIDGLKDCHLDEVSIQKIKEFCEKQK